MVILNFILRSLMNLNVFCGGLNVETTLFYVYPLKLVTTFKFDYLDSVKYEKA